MDESGEQFVAYFLPTEETLEKRRRDFGNSVEYEDEEEYEYKMAREYNWNVKSKASKGYEENYFLVIRQDGVYYNELETRYGVKHKLCMFTKTSTLQIVILYFMAFIDIMICINAVLLRSKYSTGWSRGNALDRRYWAQISATLLSVLNKVFCDFPQSLLANIELAPSLGYFHFLADASQFISQPTIQLCIISVLKALFTLRKINMETVLLSLHLCTCSLMAINPLRVIYVH